MALSPTVLSSGIKSGLDSAFGVLSDAADDSNRKSLCDAIATAVVQHIKTSAVVNVTSVSGVTTGGGVSGPGAGTIS